MKTVDNNRDTTIDCIRGLLIILVVAAHYKDGDVFHDFCFLFHMPLFFIISGYFLDKSKLLSNSYLIRRIKTFAIPYFFYLLLGFLRGLKYESLSLGYCVKYLWGGRAVSGVYWYITCYIISVCIFAFLLRHLKTKSTVALIAVGGGIAVIESNLTESIAWLRNPGIPWNIDVALMAIVYMAIGFYGKDKINDVIHSDKRMYDYIALLLTVLVIIFCALNYGQGVENEFYYFDMKPVNYKELISAVVIPCCFGFIFIRGFRLINAQEKLRLITEVFSSLGKVTMPIMFMHMIINFYSLGRIGFIVIGIGVPCICTLLLGRFPVCRVILGLPNLHLKMEKKLS